jgi:hypothetical protein
MDPAELARRAAQFEKTLDPRALWPEVDEMGFSAALEEIVRAASAQLSKPGTRGHLADPIPGGESAFGAAAFASGLGPLLGYWAETGQLEAPPVITDLLRLHLDHGRRRAAKLRAALEGLLGLLNGAGIEVTVLKGMHTGWTYFPDPGTRPASDIDLLVPGDAAGDAAELLEASGFTLLSRVSERSTWNPPGTSRLRSVYLTHADSPWVLDLHGTLDRRFSDASGVARFGTLDDADHRPWSVGGLRAWTLSQPLLACFLAVHASNHLPYLTPLRLVELALMFRADGGVGFPWERLEERLERTGLSPFGYPALKLVEDLVPGTVDRAVLARLGAVTPPAVRRLMARITPATALQMYHRSFEGRFLWAGAGWRRVGAVVAWLWPRDGDGARLPLGEALGATGLRLRRLFAGRFRRRVV